MGIVLSSMKAHSWDEVPLDNNPMIERMLAHPELAPRDKTKEILTSMLTDGSLDHLLVQEFAAKVEPYFELKDELASKGIAIFNTDIEHACSSEAVQQERSQKMVNYLLEHQCLLSADTINTNDLVNPNLIKKVTTSWQWPGVLFGKTSWLELSCTLWMRNQSLESSSLLFLSIWSGPRIGAPFCRLD